MKSFLIKLNPLEAGLIKTVACFIGFSGLISAINIILGNLTIALWIIVITFPIGLYIILFYIRYSESQHKTEIIEQGADLGKKPNFNYKQRKNAGIGLITLTIILTIFPLGYWIYINQPTNNVIILVADFEDPEQPAQKNYKVTAEIIGKLRERTKNFPNIKIRALNEHLSYKNSQEEIRSKANELEASIVIWGELGKTEQIGRLSVNIELLKKPRRLAFLNKNIVSHVPVSEIESYKAQINLSNQLSFFTLVVDGLAQTEAENYDDAIDRFTSALNQPDLSNEFVSLADVYYFRGNVYSLKSIYLMSNDSSSAIDDLSKSITLKPNFVDAYALRGFNYIQYGKQSLALKDFNEAVRLNPNSALNLFFQGLAYYANYKYDLSKDSLTRASEIQPNSYSDYFLRGAIYMFLGKNEEATQDFNQTISLNPAIKNDVLILSALNKLSQNKIDDAKKILNQIIQEKPNQILARAIRATVLIDENNPDQFISELNLLIESAPNVDKLYSIKAMGLTQFERTDEALANYSKAIEINPQNSENFFKRASLFIEIGNLDRGIPALNLPIELDSEILDKAIFDLNKAIELDSEVAEYYVERGKLLSQKKALDSATKDFIKAIELYPQYADAYLGLSKVYAEEGKFGSDEITDSKIGSIYPPNQIEKKYLIGFSYLSRGETHQKVGRLDDAINDYSKAIELLNEIHNIYLLRVNAYKAKTEILEKQKNGKEIERQTLKSTKLNLENKLKELKNEIENLSAEMPKSGNEISFKDKVKKIQSETSELVKQYNDNSREQIINLQRQSQLADEIIGLLQLTVSDQSKVTELLEKRNADLKSESNMVLLDKLPTLPIEKPQKNLE